MVIRGQIWTGVNILVMCIQKLIELVDLDKVALHEKRPKREETQDQAWGMGAEEDEACKTVERLLSERQKENRKVVCYGDKGTEYLKKQIVHKGCENC